MRLARYLMPRRGRLPREFLRRLDTLAGDVNVLLVVIAVGLGTLDLTFLLTQKIIDRLPPVTRMVQEDGSTASDLPAANRPRTFP